MARADRAGGDNGYSTGWLCPLLSVSDCKVAPDGRRRSMTAGTHLFRAGSGDRRAQVTMAARPAGRQSIWVSGRLSAARAAVRAGE